MKNLLLLSLILLLTGAILGFWYFWQRPETVEMARYIPSEALVYLEANDLPLALQSYTETAAWRELAPQFGVRKGFGEFGWLSRFLADTNLGSTETVVFGRGQVAVALFGFSTAAGGEAFKIKPLYAVVVETKSSRAPQFVEKQIGELARNQFGEISVEKSERDGNAWTIFRSKKDERKIFAAVSGTAAIFGNDESAVNSCLETKNGARRSLAENPQLVEMRQRTESRGALMFGLVTTGGVKKLSELGAVLFAAQISEEPMAMSLVAQSLPPLIEKTVAGIGWSARQIEGRIEDRYFVAVPSELTARLREPLMVSKQTNSRAAGLLPADSHSVTIYNFKNAGAAWRGLILSLTTRLDVLSAAALAQTSGKLLEPYGISEPYEFLSAAGEEIVTARLSQNENDTVAMVKTGDPNKMLAAIATADKKTNRAATISDEMLILGESDDVARCLAAKSQNLAGTDFWRSFIEIGFAPEAPFVRTFTRDNESAPSFVKIFADEKARQKVPELKGNPVWIVSASETRLLEGGFERRTRSGFGLIGTLAASFMDSK